MEENEEERRALMHTFYQIYRPIQKRMGLRCHMHFDIYGNNFIKIWIMGRKNYIYKVEDETETECYKRAIEMLKSYSGRRWLHEEIKSK